LKAGQSLSAFGGTILSTKSVILYQITKNVLFESAIFKKLRFKNEE
jgi:hypothetical protein